LGKTRITPARCWTATSLERGAIKRETSLIKIQYIPELVLRNYSLTAHRCCCLKKAKLVQTLIPSIKP
jgi:hypothetical protein